MEYNFSWTPFLKITNLCNYNCAHCCERSGPCEKNDFLSIELIDYVLQSFKMQKNMIPIVTITGGEPLMAYTNHSVHYIPQLLKLCAKNNLGMEIKTNAGWVLEQHAPQIFSDLENHSAKYINQPIAYHLSLDRFHKKSIETTLTFIKWFVDNNKISNKNIIHLFYDTTDIFVDTMFKLKEKHDVILTNEENPNGFFSALKPNLLQTSAGKSRPIIFEPYNGINNSGRAKDLGVANKSVSFLELINTKHHQVRPIQFDNNGNATLFACNDFGISVPFRACQNKTKPLSVIKRELFQQAYALYCAEMQSYMNNSKTPIL